MASKGIRVEGVAELRKQLRALPRKLRDGAAAAIAEAAGAVKADARSLVRVDEGDLRDGIGVRIQGDGLSAQVGVTDNDLYYGPFQEFGTSSIPPKPFMTPAAEAERRRLPGRIEKAVKGRLR